VQVGAGDPASAAAAARLVARDCVGVDLNMGCPKRFSLTDGMGAALLRDPARAAAIVRSMRAACPDDVAVSAKIRFAGTAADEAAAIDATEALCRALDAAGAAAITLHCRYAGDAPERTPCHRETARRLVRRLREGADEFRAALLLNGDFYDVDDARQACRGPGGVGEPASVFKTLMIHHLSLSGFRDCVSRRSMGSSSRDPRCSTRRSSGAPTRSRGSL